MKAVRYLIPVLGVAVICSFAVFAAGQKQSAPSANAAPASDTRGDDLQATLPALQAQQEIGRRILDANPTLVAWLLELTVTKGDVELPSAHNALAALAPIAAVELLKEVDNKNSEVRKVAMHLLSRGATSPAFPQQEVVAKLLKIAKNEKEDEAIRQYATMTVCQIICAVQGAPFQLPPG